MDALHPGSVCMAKVCERERKREEREEREGALLDVCFSYRPRLVLPPLFSFLPLLQVDFNSRSEYDSINNYKALQAAFDRVGLDKVRERKKGIWFFDRLDPKLTRPSAFLSPSPSTSPSSSRRARWTT